MAAFSAQSLAKTARGWAEMDTTAIGIAAGVSVSVAYAGITAYLKKTLEISHTVLIFLAAFSVPGGVALIVSGFIGNPQDLPSSWREHVVVAGIVAIGLAIDYVVREFKKCFGLTKKPAEVNAQKESNGS